MPSYSNSLLNKQLNDVRNVFMNLDKREIGNEAKLRIKNKRSCPHGGRE